MAGFISNCQSKLFPKYVTPANRFLRFNGVHDSFKFKFRNIPVQLLLTYYLLKERN